MIRLGDALSVHRVIGTVSLWGRVVECKRGWRASHAYPKVIYVPTTRSPSWLRAERPHDVALALTDYGVPVELLDTDARDPKRWLRGSAQDQPAAELDPGVPVFSPLAAIPVR